VQTCPPLDWLSAVIPSPPFELAVLSVMELPLQWFCAMPTAWLLELCTKVETTEGQILFKQMLVQGCSRYYIYECKYLHAVELIAFLEA